MVRLADTSIRLYRKKNGKVSVKLRSYLMIKTNCGFNLGAYLKDISCVLTFYNGERMVFDDVAFAVDMECEYQLDTMVHTFWASGITEMDVLKFSIGKLCVNFLISFTGHPSEEPDSVEYIVPLIPIPTVYG